MKRIFTAMIAVAAALSAGAQNIPNGSFENWTTVGGNLTLDNWYYLGLSRSTFINVTSGGVTTSRTPTNGQYFAGVQNIISGGQGFLGRVGAKFAYASRPATLRWDMMYFKSASLTGEGIQIFVGMLKKNGANMDTIAWGYSSIAGNTVANWTGLTLDLSGAYRSAFAGVNPDTAWVQFTLLPNTSSQISTDCRLFLDAVRFSEFGTGVNDITPDNMNKASLLNVFPNPAREEATISFTTYAEMNTTVEVFDLQGRKVSSVFSGKLEGGDHSFKLKTNGLATGMYIYRVNTAGSSQSGRLVVE